MSQERRDRIMEATSSENWKEIVLEYKFETQETIEASLDQLLPAEDNSQLAADIYKELNS